MTHQRRRLTAILLLVGATVLAPLQARGKTGMPACTTLATTITFATDGILFCGTGFRSMPARGSGVDLYRSEDAGHTWAGPFRVGGPDSGSLAMAIFVSPNYGFDHSLFVGTDTGGFFSSDRGQTFTRVNGSFPFNHKSTTVYLNRLANAMASRPALIAVPLVTDPGPCCARVWDSLVPDHGRHAPPNLVDWVFARHYVVPPDFPETRQAVMVGRPGLWNDNAPDLSPGHSKAYLCDAAFNCLKPIYDFAPPGEMADTRITFTGSTYVGSPDTYVQTYSDTERPSLRLFRSPDYGRTWTPWTSATKLLAGLRWDTEVKIVASPDAPRRMFLFVGAVDSGPANVPEQRVFRSDDNGATWRLIGYSWGPTQHARNKSTLPWNSGGIAYQPPVVGPGGRLWVTAAHRVGAWQTSGSRVTLKVYCSRDYGRSWVSRC